MLKTALADIYISSQAPDAACSAGQADRNSRLLKSFVCSNVILAKRGDKRGKRTRESSARAEFISWSLAEMV